MGEGGREGVGAGTRSRKEGEQKGQRSLGCLPGPLGMISLGCFLEASRGVLGSLGGPGGISVGGCLLGCLRASWGRCSGPSSRGAMGSETARTTTTLKSIIRFWKDVGLFRGLLLGDLSSNLGPYWSGLGAASRSSILGGHIAASCAILSHLGVVLGSLRTSWTRLGPSWKFWPLATPPSRSMGWGS